MSALGGFRWTWVSLAFLVAVGCAGCGGGSSDDPFSTSARFDAGPCPAEQAKALADLNARCGTLTATQNRSKGGDAKVKLPVAIVPSVKQPPEPDPVVYMAGGPGANAIAQAGILVSVGLNKNRDLIIMNQRGVAYTEPLLTCPEIDKFYALAVGLPYDAPETGVLHVAATKACHDRLVAAGIDLGAFNTSENSADFADLRKALRIEQWNVYGLSYGTDLALSLQRDHPEGIRSVIIDAVVPPAAASLGWTWTNANEAVNNIFRACNAQPACLARYGDLSAVFAGQVRKLEANPLTITVEQPFGSVKVVLDGGAILNWLASVPDPVVAIPSIPAAIEELVSGHPIQIAASRATQADPAAIGAVGYGLMYGVICSEWVPFEPQSQILVQGLLAFPSYPTSVLSLAAGLPYMNEDCAVWNVPKAAASVRSSTTGSIPTLVMAGAFDGKTSPQWAIYAAGPLDHATTVVIPDGGHGALFLIGLPDDSPAKPCAISVVASFLANPMSPNTACVKTLTPYPFVISAGAGAAQ
jgi:pimeloyl-ACP methyl ester carboxylesterase